MILCFAYGSNMDQAEMLKCCPHAKFKCTAKLKNYCLAFTRKSIKRGCGVSDVQQAEGQEVWGVVYEIPENEMPDLDRKEGINSKSYTRRQGIVYQDGDANIPLEVEIYFAVPEEAPPPPNQAYKNHIVNGAKHWNLPKDYIEQLEKIEVAG